MQFFLNSLGVKDYSVSDHYDGVVLQHLLSRSGLCWWIGIWGGILYVIAGTLGIKATYTYR